jgi:hypothetical protein
MIVYNGVDHGVVTAILQRVIHERFCHRDLRIGWNRVLPVWSKENSLPPWVMHVEDLEEEYRLLKQAKEDMEEYRLLRQAREEMYAEHLALKEQITKETQRLKEENEELVRGIKFMEDSEQCN